MDSSSGDIRRIDEFRQIYENLVTPIFAKSLKENEELRAKLERLKVAICPDKSITDIEELIDFAKDLHAHQKLSTVLQLEAELAEAKEKLGRVSMKNISCIILETIYGPVAGSPVIATKKYSPSALAQALVTAINEGKKK